MNSFQEGVKAYQTGLSLEDNPYGQSDQFPFSIACAQWRNGFLRGQKREEGKKKRANSQ